MKTVKAFRTFSPFTIAQLLLVKSQWFEVTPLPGGEFEICVKPNAARYVLEADDRATCCDPIK